MSPYSGGLPSFSAYRGTLSLWPLRGCALIGTVNGIGEMSFLDFHQKIWPYDVGVQSRCPHPRSDQTRSGIPRRHHALLTASLD